MEKPVLLTLVRYTDWANDCVASAIAALPSEELARTFSGTFRTFRDGVAHIAGAEWLWLARWKGESPSSLPSWVESADIAALRLQMRDLARERLERLEATDEAQLGEIITCRSLKGDRVWTLRTGDLLLHVVNHSTHHRGQLVSMLRKLGVTPPATDLLLYVTDIRA